MLKIEQVQRVLKVKEFFKLREFSFFYHQRSKSSWLAYLPLFLQVFMLPSHHLDAFSDRYEMLTRDKNQAPIDIVIAAKISRDTSGPRCVGDRQCQLLSRLLLLPQLLVLKTISALLVLGIKRQWFESESWKNSFGLNECLKIELVP